MTAKTLVTGFPRIGEHRELKFALEKYWAGSISAEELDLQAQKIRKKHLLLQFSQGIDLISCNDFSYYDLMLDTMIMLNAIPRRFRSVEDRLERYFTMARGSANAPALEMTKWFNTNYHYLVPELEKNLEFSLDATKILEEYKEARILGIKPKINILGPVTFLALSKVTAGDSPFIYFGQVLEVYRQLFEQLSELDNDIVIQLEEPIFVMDSGKKLLAYLKQSLHLLGAVSGRIRILVSTYFEHSLEALPILGDAPIWGIALDFVNGCRNMEGLKFLGEKILVAGIVDGRNIWINNYKHSVNLLEDITKIINPDNVIISTSCSLVHVPYSIAGEPESGVKHRFAFACEKVKEVALLGKIFAAGSRTPMARKLIAERSVMIKDSSEFVNAINASEYLVRDGSFLQRINCQKKILGLPVLPTTTIGSFPQTRELRRLRRDYKNGDVCREIYEKELFSYIDDSIDFQEKIGLDVLVHGEPERNDMVEYFGELLDGFHFTQNGWVQSYGSRCVKPPVIYTDVSRPFPMTVKWISYAQSRTNKIIKGMLTGPVTILNWSFVRTDLPRGEVARQVALALRSEVSDLQAAGIRIIQVDEAAFKEGYPLREEDIAEYEKWAVGSFKTAVSSARMETQIHTHMCYSSFNDIIGTIEAMDADVITIETARSGNKLLKIFRETGYEKEIGPGVYDIHSPRIPSEEEFRQQIIERLKVIDKSYMWVNPDCGLKTRNWAEVGPALTNMVKAVKKIRLTM